MSHRIERGTDEMYAEYSWGVGDRRCLMALSTTDPGFLPAESSMSEFITEHYWGYAVRGGRTVEYQVEHPQWIVREATNGRFEGDGARYYGAEFGAVLQRK